MGLHMSKALLVAVAVSTCVGCARVSVTKVTDATKPTNGVRFYRPTPYLLVTVVKVGDKDQVASNIIYLPNTKDEYVVEVKPGWGTVDGTVTLDGGWNLTTLGAKLDSKGPETITAVAGAIPSLTGIASTQANLLADSLTPGLYKFLYDGHGMVSELQRVEVKEPRSKK